MLTILAALALAPAAPCGTLGSPRETAPQHFVFFRRDHERVADTNFLNNPNVVGAQLTYTWRELEPVRDRYSFDALRERLAFLSARHKRLFLQLQDVSFTEAVVTPDYLRTDTTFHGGIARKVEADASGRIRFGGWVVRRWDPAVRERFARLVRELAREFDGAIEGVVLPETSVGFDDPSNQPTGFTPDVYAQGVRDMLSAAKQAFQQSCVVTYANFMPGESLPKNDRGYLRGVHAHAAAIGAGVGGPDILPHRPYQRSHSLSLIEQRAPGVIAAMAVQDGNLADRNRSTGQPITVGELYTFATTRLRLDYIFWGTEEPSYSTRVLPFLRQLRAR